MNSQKPLKPQKKVGDGASKLGVFKPKDAAEKWSGLQSDPAKENKIWISWCMEDHSKVGGLMNEIPVK